MTTPNPGAFPFSMFDPVHLSIDENGEHVYVNLAERNMLLGAMKTTSARLSTRSLTCSFSHRQASDVVNRCCHGRRPGPR